MPIELSRAKVKFIDAEGNSAQINTVALESSLEDIQQLTEESITNINAAKASSLGDISDATTQAINALDNAIGEVPLEDADDLRYTIAENATSPTTKAYAVGEYFYYGLTDDNKSDLCRVTKAIASGDTIYKTGVDKNCESVTKGIANVVNEEVTNLKSASFQNKGRLTNGADLNTIFDNAIYLLDSQSTAQYANAPADLSGASFLTVKQTSAIALQTIETLSGNKKTRYTDDSGVTWSNWM